jgi:PleD family two-component response regulator
MSFSGTRVLLVDNDMDDCLLFREALQELAFDGDLTTLHDGEQLMNFLMASKQFLPDMLFLDLNMPRKNGFECLSEIMKDSELKELPVIIYSTSYETRMVDRLLNDGARLYIQKPAHFDTLKDVVLRAISTVSSLSGENYPLEKKILYP